MINAPPPPPDVSRVQGDNNWTPLHCSSFHGKLEIVEMLLRHGADQAAKDLRGRTSAAVCDMGLYDVEQVIYCTTVFLPFLHFVSLRPCGLERSVSSPEI